MVFGPDGTDDAHIPALSTLPTRIKAALELQRYIAPRLVLGSVAWLNLYITIYISSACAVGKELHVFFFFFEKSEGDWVFSLTHSVPSPRASLSSDAIVAEFKNVNILYTDGTLTLKDIHWTFTRGQHWHICGDNGSGKSSICKLLLGEHPQVFYIMNITVAVASNKQWTHFLHPISTGVF